MRIQDRIFLKIHASLNGNRRLSSTMTNSKMHGYVNPSKPVWCDNNTASYSEPVTPIQKEYSARIVKLELALAKAQCRELKQKIEKNITALRKQYFIKTRKHL